MRRIALFASLAAFAVLPTAVAAQGAACGKRADILGKLAEEYREAPIAMGMGADGGVVELVTASGGATWTLLHTRPSGVTCVMAVGEAWEQTPGAAALLGPEA